MSEEFNRSQLAYLEGFVQKCETHDVDPETMLADKVAAEGEHGAVRRVAGGAGKGALAGAGIGAGMGATAGLINSIGGSRLTPAARKLTNIVRSALGGAIGGASAGAIVGGATRAVS